MGQGWRQFTRDWKQTARIALWLLVGPALSFIEVLLRVFVFNASNNPASVGLFGIVDGVLSFAISIFSAVMAIMVALRLYQFIQKRDQSASEKSGLWPWKKFWPFIWIAVLLWLIMLIPLVVGLIAGGLLMPSISNFQTSHIILAVGIGFLIIFLPMIYLGIRYGFAAQLLLEDDDHGTKAIHQSARLVHGRWWKTFWRLFVPGLVYGIATLAVSLIGVALFAGFAYLLAPNEPVFSFLTTSRANASFGLLAFFVVFVPAAIQICLGPYILTVQVKLFHALKKTV